MEHPSIIGDELAWAILNSSRPYESNPQTKSLQQIYENASDMIKSEREVPIVYGMFDGP